MRFFDTGHFALETHCDEIAKVIGDFLDARVVHEHVKRTERIPAKLVKRKRLRIDERKEPCNALDDP